MEFYDFELRAWRESKTHIQVIVHSSLAGDMEKPIKVAFDERKLRLPQHWFRVDTETVVATGHQLTAALLPRPGADRNLVLR
jgi:hypothetical protein